jgi:hypothetical protein
MSWYHRTTLSEHCFLIRVTEFSFVLAWEPLLPIVLIFSIHGFQHSFIIFWHFNHNCCSVSMEDWFLHLLHSCIYHNLWMFKPLYWMAWCLHITYAFSSVYFTSSLYYLYCVLLLLHCDKVPHTNILRKERFFWFMVSEDSVHGGLRVTEKLKSWRPRNRKIECLH